MSFVGDMKGRASDIVDRLLVGFGFGHSESRLERDAATFWTGEEDDHWRNSTHINDGSVFDQVEWESVGRRHLELFDRMSYSTRAEGPLTRAVEWGVGGGANAVAFAPSVDEFVGVDVKQSILDAASSQVAKYTDTPFTPVLVDVEHPESAEAEIGTVDLFLCLYVLELVPSQQYGLRVMQIAHRLLSEGGLAFVQIKYDTGRWNTRSRGRRYRGSVAASMTTWRIDEFWSLMTDMGFEIENGVHLVPKNELDERYAYFLLRKPLQAK